MPMSNKSTTSNKPSPAHREKQFTTQKMCWVTFNFINCMHNTATNPRWAKLHSKAPPTEKTAHMTTLPSSLRCESTAEHHTAEHYSQTSRTMLSDRQIKTPKISQKESKTMITNITRSADSFGTIPSRVNSAEWR